MANNREKEIVQAVVNILAEVLSPSRIILFGSRAKGNNEQHADFDFAVDIPRPDISMERKIKDEVEKASGLYKVDIIYLDDVDEDFKNIVLGTGKVIYER
ncbi:MAG: nucleotidyltransferase domain-containing protein [Candidatus Omnitrophota bacterium]|nr:nucleotidyltransferase domain-containing protein [Candidatus Omnitrophota bacterium]